MNTSGKKMIIVMIAGLLALGFGIFGIVSDKNAAKTNTGVATATVIDYDVQMELDSNDNEDECYYPIVKYKADGENVTATYSQYYSSMEYEIGEEVAIHYNPDKVTDFTIDGDNRGTSAAKWMIPVGIILLIFSLGRMIFPFIASRRQ